MLDLMMPIMGGPEVLKAIRNNSSVRHARRVARPGPRPVRLRAAHRPECATRARTRGIGTVRASRRRRAKETAQTPTPTGDDQGRRVSMTLKRSARLASAFEEAADSATRHALGLWRGRPSPPAGPAPTCRGPPTR